MGAAGANWHQLILKKLTGAIHMACIIFLFGGPEVKTKVEDLFFA